MSVKEFAHRASHLTLRQVQRRAHELHAEEAEGESAATPLLALAGVWLFIFPLFVLMLGSALLAYYLA